MQTHKKRPVIYWELDEKGIKTELIFPDGQTASQFFQGATA